MKIALVIGYGSIGQRHVRLLKELGCQVGVVSRRLVNNCKCFESIHEAIKAMPPDYVVVANETSAHLPAVVQLSEAGFRGRLLVEKPLGATQVPSDFVLAAVGYNLRFHPVLAALAAEVADEKAVAAQIYCGQYLPAWRPRTDYRLSYSADPSRGGGVLRDLSHELDYLLWLFGPWRHVAAIGGRFGALPIASDDCWGLLVELERCRCATVQVNYLDRPGRRQMIINSQDHTYVADLMANTLITDGESRSFEVRRDEMHLAQHRAMLAGDTERLCSFAEGARVMDFIAAAERAARERRWV